MTDDESPGAIRQLAQRAVDTVVALARRGVALAGGVLMFAVLSCVIGFSLGYAALSDGMRTVWIVLGGFFAIVAIGSAVLAIVRLQAVRSTSRELVDEVTSLISGDERAERTVIETIEVADASEQSSAVVVSRQFFTLQDQLGDRTRQFVAVGAALRALTMFPALIALATVISFVFLGLGLLFLIALAL